MKKVSVLALALGIVGLANAGIMITSDKQLWVMSETAVITVSSDTPLLGGWSGLVGIVLGANAEWTGNYVDHRGRLDTPFDIYLLDPPDPFLNAWYVDMTTPSITPDPAGDYISFALHCTGIGLTEVIVTDVDGNVLDQITIMESPEPATMVLLGLGALGLLRKRRA